MLDVSLSVKWGRKGERIVGAKTQKEGIGKGKWGEGGGGERERERETVLV